MNHTPTDGSTDDPTDGPTEFARSRFDPLRCLPGTLRGEGHGPFPTIEEAERTSELVRDVHGLEPFVVVITEAEAEEP